MRAVTFHRYGRVTVLGIEDVAVPAPAPGEVRVRVAYAGLNAFDWHQYTGRPLIMRGREGWRVREPRTLGADFAGTVDAVGQDVEGIAVGDRVMGSNGRGALAEWVTAPTDRLAVAPAGVNLTQAAALPMAGVTALQALRDIGALKPGESVLVWGASGGVGHLAVQLARALGASRVDAVCSGRNVAMVRGLGADAVADYTANERPPGGYDLVVDLVATQSLSSLRALLTDGGRVVTVGGVTNGLFLGPGRSILGRVVLSRLHGVAHAMFVADVASADLGTVAALAAEGQLRAVIHRIAPFDESREACAELEAGHVPGKLLVEIDPSEG